MVSYGYAFETGNHSMEEALKIADKKCMNIKNKKYRLIEAEVKFMGFRTLEISHAAEIHIKEGQLEVTTEDGLIL